MSKVHSVPRKQGMRPAGTDFVHFGVESLFARSYGHVCTELSFHLQKRINLSKDDMHNFLETCSPKTGMDFRGQV